MKKQLLLSGLMLGIALCVSAQTPGYMGMRFFLKPEFSSAVAFFNPTANNRGGGDDPETGKTRFGLNTRYGLQAGYVLSRKWVAALEGSHIKTGMPLQVETASVAFPNKKDSHELFYNIGGPEFGVSFQSYNLNKGNLAPLGAYVALRARASFLKGEIFEQTTTYYNNASALGHRPLGIDARFTNVNLGIEIGSHHIVADHILLGVGAELNLSMGLHVTPDTHNQEEFNRVVSNRISRHSLFFFKLSAGYLF